MERFVRIPKITRSPENVGKSASCVILMFICLLSAFYVHETGGSHPPLVGVLCYVPYNSKRQHTPSDAFPRCSFFDNDESTSVERCAFGTTSFHGNNFQPSFVGITSPPRDSYSSSRKSVLSCVLHGRHLVCAFIQ